MNDQYFQEWLEYEYSFKAEKPELVETLISPCGEVYRMVQFWDNEEVCLFVEIEDESGLDNQTHILAVGWSDGAFGKNGCYSSLDEESPFERMREFVAQMTTKY